MKNLIKAPHMWAAPPPEKIPGAPNSIKRFLSRRHDTKPRTGHPYTLSLIHI